MWFRCPIHVLLPVAVLAWSAALADDVHKPAEEPDPGFLEFLGSVDRLSDVMPDYLSQADPRGTSAPGTAPAPPPPPRPAPPPNAPPNGSGGHDNG